MQRLKPGTVLLGVNQGGRLTVAVLRANSIHDWTAYFLQSLGNEHGGKEIDGRLLEDARLPATVALSRTLPLPASVGGIRGGHL